MIEHIGYSKYSGFLGIRQQDKDQWLQKYSYITDFEINFKECKEWLSKDYKREYQAEQRPRDVLEKWLGCEWLKLKENISTEPDKLHNPKRIINYINKYFENEDFIAQIVRGKQEGYSDTLARKHYNKAINYVLKIREEIPEFPLIPEETEKSHFDLRKLHEWCIECEQIIENLYSGIMLDNISKVLSMLNELRELLKDNEPQIDEKQWNKINDRIWKELETLGKILKNSEKTLRHWKCRAVSDQDYKLLISKMTENKLYVPDDRNELIEIIDVAESIAEVDWDKVKEIEEELKQEKNLQKKMEIYNTQTYIVSNVKIANKKINEVVWKVYCRENQDFAEKYDEKQEKIQTIFNNSAEFINSDKCLTKVAFLREEKLNSDFKRLGDSLFTETIIEIDKDKVLKEIIDELEFIHEDAKKYDIMMKSAETEQEISTIEYSHKLTSSWWSISIPELLAKGESHNLEFKETLEYDIRQNQQNRGLNKECLKTIAAFLNTDGGTLLIGVSDSGEVKGISRDLKFVRGNNSDGFEQKLRSLINDSFDPSPLGKVSISFEELQEGTVSKIDVQPVNKDTIIHFDKDVYVRDGNRSIKLEGRALTDWIRQRTE